MPLYRAILAALLLSVPVWAEDPAVPARPQDKTPQVELDPSEPVDLLKHPELASPYDRRLLTGAGYEIKDGLIRLTDSEEEPLTPVRLREVLEALKAKRRQEVLSGLAAIQQATWGAGHSSLDKGQAARVTALLESDWELIPANIRSGMNEWLENSGFPRAKSPSLDQVRRAGDAWKKELPSVPGADQAGRTPPSTIDAFKPSWERTTNVFARPPPEEIQRRIEAVGKATYRDPDTGKLVPYSAEVKETLVEIIRYASDEDGRAVLRVLEEEHPPIDSSNKKMIPFTSAHATFPDPWSKPENRVRRVVMPEFDAAVVREENGEKILRFLPHCDPEFYKEIGLPVPDLDAIDPDAKCVQEFSDHTARWQRFKDGSMRAEFTTRVRAPILLHELIHVDTIRGDQGVHMFTNEMRSFYAEQRFRFNRDQAAMATWQKGYGERNLWLTNPLAFRENVLAAYMSPQLGEVRQDQVTVASQLSQVEADLAKTGDEFEAARRREIDRRLDRPKSMLMSVVDYQLQQGLIDREQARKARRKILREIEKRRGEAYRDESLDYREMLEWQRERLRRDQELEVQVWLDDYRWHKARGVEYQRIHQGDR